MKRNKMTRKFSLSVSRFATAAVSVAVAIVLSTPQSGAAEVIFERYEGKPTHCDLAKTKAQTAFVACITKAQAKGQAASGALFVEEREINGPNCTSYLYLPVALRDVAACKKTLAKAFDSAETRLADCTSMIRTAQEFVDWAFGPGGLNPPVNCSQPPISWP